MSAISEKLNQLNPVILVLVRIVVGAAMMIHGYGKLDSGFGGFFDGTFSDNISPGFVGLVKSLGLPLPVLQAHLAFVAEFFGGLALIIGLLTRLASLGLCSTMAVAIYFHAGLYAKQQAGAGNEIGFFETIIYGFINKDSSYELPLVFLLLCLFFVTYGAGKFSLDHLFFGKKKTKSLEENSATGINL